MSFLYFLPCYFLFMSDFLSDCFGRCCQVWNQWLRTFKALSHIDTNLLSQTLYFPDNETFQTNFHNLITTLLTHKWELPQMHHKFHTQISTHMWEAYTSLQQLQTICLLIYYITHTWIMYQNTTTIMLSFVASVCIYLLFIVINRMV